MSCSGSLLLTTLPSLIVLSQALLVPSCLQTHAVPQRPSVHCPLSQTPLSSWSSIPGCSALPSFTSCILTVPRCSSLSPSVLHHSPRHPSTLPRCTSGCPSPPQAPIAPLPRLLGPKCISASLSSPGLETGLLTAFREKLGVLRLGSSHTGGPDTNVPSGDEAGSAARRAPRKGFGPGIAPLSGRPLGLAARRRRGGGRRRHVVGSPYKYGRRPRRRRRPSARQGT